MSTETAHATGFHHGVAHALWLDANIYATDTGELARDEVRPPYLTEPEGIAAYNQGWGEGVEYIETIGEDFEGIGSSDGVHYDEDPCWIRQQK